MAKVNTKHTEFIGAETIWQRCRDFVAGSDAVKERGETYLSKLGAQETEAYEAYKDRAQFYNATGRTVDGLAGLVMRIDPKVELPGSLEALETDVDYAGTTLFEFANLQVRETMTAGRTGILVDMPQRGEDIVTVADALAENLRPYLAHYPAESILNWRTKRVNGVTVLTLVTLYEVVQEIGADGDPFVLVDKIQYRVLTLDADGYMQQVFVEQDEEFVQVGDDILPMQNNARMGFIPFVFIGSETNKPNVQKPPVLDLVNVNLGHYRNSADLEHGMHFTGLPTPVITGHTVNEGESIAIGSETFLILSNKDAKATFLEFTGTGLTALESGMKTKQQQMATLGARLLAEDSKGVEAEETARIHRSGEGGVLAQLTGSVAKGIKKALTWAAEWAGATADQVEFELNKDFLPVHMDAPMLTALLTSWQSGGISHDVLFDNLKRGEIVRGETTLEKMQEDIGGELPGAGPPGSQDGDPGAE